MLGKNSLSNDSKLVDDSSGVIVYRQSWINHVPVEEENLETRETFLDGLVFSKEQKELTMRMLRKVSAGESPQPSKSRS